MKLVGIVLVVVGTLMLLVNTGVVPAVNWGIILPSIFVIFGVSLFIKHGCYNGVCKMGKGMCGSSKEMECEGGKCEEGECTDCK